MGKVPKFGPFDCLNAGLPCNLASSASAAKKQIKAAWTKAGGKSYKYMAAGYCPSQVSQSNTWQTGNVTWKFSKLKRALGKKGKKSKKNKRELGKKKNKKSKKERRLAGCVNGYWAMHTRNTLKDPNFGPFDCLNAGLPCNLAKNASDAKKQIKAAWTKAGGKSYKYMAAGY